MSRRWPEHQVRGTTLYRHGVRSARAREAHTWSTTQWRRDRADAQFPDEVRATILRRTENGGSLPEICAELEGVDWRAVYAYAARHPEFAAALDDAQRAAAPADTPHGTHNGYRHYGCRCKDCRTAKNPQKQEARP